MAGQQKHIINRQILELHTGSRKDAYEMQQKLRDAYYAQVLPVMEEVFSGLIGPEEILRIDRLEITLGNIRKDKIEEVLPQLIRKDLQDALLRQMQQARREKPIPDRADAEKDIPVFSAARESDFGVYLFFLKHGFLPWWARRPHYPSMQQLGQQLWRERQENLLSEIRIHTSDPVFIRRLICHFPEKSLGQVIRALNPAVYLLLQQVHEPLLVFQQERPFIRLSIAAFKQLLWQGAMRYAVTADAGTAAATIGENRQAARKDPAASYLLFLLCSLSASARENTQALIKALGLRLSRHSPARNRQAAKRLRAMFGRINAMPADYDVKGKDWLHPDTTPAREIFEGCVSNAGIVILWPYLLHLFAGLGWVRDKAFTDTEAAGKAALLLQFMATGQETFEEQELMLNKLLCGLEIPHPVDIQLTLTPQEKEEAENLLRFVADQWKALKGISIAGLRESFLKKEGILKQEPKGWVLQVERSTIDLLVDKLPWAISLIRLPWNNYLLYVEW